MRSNTWLQKQMTRSPLASQGVLRPKGGKVNRTLVASLMLTSLVDAFSILVIFLLMNASSSTESVEIKNPNGIPLATNSDALKNGVVLNIENDKYMVGDRAVKLEELDTVLAQEKLKIPGDQAQVPLVIKASKQVDYKELSPILIVASQAKFEQYKLVVIDQVAH